MTESEIRAAGQRFRLGEVTNLDLACEVMKVSWRHDPGRALYSPELVANVVQSPGDGSPLLPALFSGGEMAAFVMGFPRTCDVAGQVRKLMMMTFFTVAEPFKGQGLGKAVWAACLRASSAMGYDGAVYYCVDGNVSNHVTATAAVQAGFVAHPVCTVRFLARLVRPRHADASPELSDPAVLVRMASAVPALPLRRIWTLPEARWRLWRPGTLATYAPDTGTICGYAVALDDAGTKAALIDEVLWTDASEERRDGLVRRFLDQAAANGVSVVSVPVLGYTDLKPFERAGFRQSGRILNAYFAAPCGFPGLQTTSVYIDVL